MAKTNGGKTNGKVPNSKTARNGGRDITAPPYLGGVIGAVVGAAVGAVAVRAMSDKQTRTKITGLLEHTFDVLRDINEERNGVQKVVSGVIDDVKDVAERKLLRKAK